MSELCWATEAVSLDTVSLDTVSLDTVSLDTIVPDLETRFDQLLGENGPALRRVAASYEADPGRREDLVQDICLAIWQALPRYRGEATERTFVFRIAHNRGLSHSWRRRSATATAAADSEEVSRVVDPRVDPETAAAEAQRRQRLESAVRSLPVALRQVVTLSLEGLSYKEIADVLGITESNVGVRLNRGKKALRGALEGQVQENQAPGGRS